jgi:hypothetical protein
MIPVPVRVEVILIVLLPVLIHPVVMVRVGTVTLLNNVTPVAAAPLLTTNVLKVVDPVMVELAAPKN